MFELLGLSALNKLQQPSVERLVIAVSGGVDSSALLHAVSRAITNVQVVGLHIHHGLVGNADLLAESAQRGCDVCNVQLVTIPVEVPMVGSVEAAARKARYAVFFEFLVQGDLLLLAHHADDQVETALFNLFRGSRVPGVRGMPKERQLGRGSLYRPFLELSREKILAYAKRNELPWVEDDSNSDLRFDRNYIRHSVLPVIESRWPKIRKQLINGMNRDDSARSILRERNSRQLGTVRIRADCLRLEALRVLPEKELVDLLGMWLDELGLGMQTGRFLRRVAVSLARHQLIDVRLGQLEIRQHKGLLYALKKLPEANIEEFRLRMGENVLAGGFLLNVLKKGEGLREDDYFVRYRRGGESLRLRRKRSLKNLCQELGLPAWLRARTPLIYKGDKLVAIAEVPAWGFPMKIADGHSVKASESGFNVSMHLQDRF